MLRLICFLIAFIFSHPAFAAPGSCSAGDLAATFDEAAATLRRLNVDSEQRFQTKLREEGKARKWSETQIRAKGEAQLDDPKLEDFNREIETLVSRMDSLSTISGGEVACERLDELRRTRDRLLTVMGQKSGYMLAALDVGMDAPLSPPSFSPPAQAAPLPGPPAAAPPPPASPPPTALSPRPAPRSDQPPPPEKLAPLPWRTETARRPADSAPDDWSASPPPARPNPPDQPGGEAFDPGNSDGSASAEVYSIDDIREAGQGVFGTLSSEFAGVINYAFQNYGQPNAYISGSDGGASFLAGLRYGKGRLHRKSAEPERIYWQGPSVGVDFGASGSRLMLLVYNLKDPKELHARFTGVEGSAYVVGGVGLTVLKNDDVVLVPIRTGLGLRVGASLTYLKFTERQTWNPF